MADSAARNTPPSTRAGSTKRRASPVSTDTENKLARAARSAQRLAQLTELPRDDGTADLFPDDAARATQQALNIDIRQGTLSGFELPDELLAAASATTAASAGSSAASSSATSAEAKATRRASRTAKVDRGGVAATEAGVDGVAVAVLRDVEVDHGERQVGISSAAGRPDVDPVTVAGGEMSVAGDEVTPVESSSAANSADDASADVARATKADDAARADDVSASVSSSESVPVSGSATLMQNIAAMRQAQLRQTQGTHPDAGRGPQGAMSVAGASVGSGSVAGTRRGAAEPSPRFASTLARAGSAPSDDAGSSAGTTPRATPELERARATAFADTVDALYGVIADQRRTAGEHSRRMKWLLTIVVCALLVTVAIGVAQTLLLMRLTRDTTLQQQRIEQMILSQQATLSTLLDTDSATVSAPAYPSDATPRASVPAAPSTDATGKHTAKPHHTHKAKPGQN